MEDVTLKPAALTQWAALHVPVYQDTPEMDLIVQVTDLWHIDHVLRIQCDKCDHSEDL